MCGCLFVGWLLLLLLLLPLITNTGVWRSGVSWNTLRSLLRFIHNNVVKHAAALFVTPLTGKGGREKERERWRERKRERERERQIAREVARERNLISP